MSLLFGFFLFTIQFCLLITAQSTAPIVDLGYVKVQGWTNTTSGLNYYHGIQYAQNPGGENRWKRPIPVELNESYVGQVLNVTQRGPSCFQAVASWEPAIPPIANTLSEDCLILDVITPANPTSSHIAVLVGIHGGGYIQGDVTYQPGDSAVYAANGSLLFVNIQYRLGAYGFLGGSQVRTNGVLNAGLWDQRAALDWVQRHISAFGGDPNQVTIVGGSAGGGSVLYQLMAGGGWGHPPFRAAIPEYPWTPTMINETAQDQQFNNLLSLANCTDINCLRTIPEAQFNTIQLASYISGSANDLPDSGIGIFYWQPVVDGEFLQEFPSSAFKNGRFYHVPILVDHDAHEGVLFTTDNVTTESEQETDALTDFPNGSPAFFSRLFQIYPVSNFNNSGFNQRAAWFGDYSIACPTYYTAYGGATFSTNGSAVFKLINNIGTGLHGSVTGYIFSDVAGQFPGASNQTVASILSTWYLSFILTKDPNTLPNPGAPFWPSYFPNSNGEFTIMLVNDTSIAATPDAQWDASYGCEFWGSYQNIVRN